MFYNFSTQKFTYTWGGKPFSFEPGKVYDGIVISDDKTESVMLNDVVSKFFAKHLAEHLLNGAFSENFTVNKEGTKVPTDGYPTKYNFSNMEALTERGITPPSKDVVMPSIIAELPIIKPSEDKPTEQLEVVTEILKDEAEAPKKKGGRSKKVLSPSPEATEFVGV